MTPAARADAVRSRERILAAASGCDVRSLRLNEVAREAGVGVGTVYRHFPTVEALVGALSLDTLRRLREVAERAGEDPDAASAIRTFLSEALALQLENGGLQTVLTAATQGNEESRALSAEIFAAFAGTLARAQREGLIRSDITVLQVHHLVCGVEHAVRLGSPADRALLLDVMLAGLAGEPRR